MLRALFLVVAVFPGAADDASSGAAEYHPWVTFEVGSWKQVRIVQETLASSGQVETVTTTDLKTTLMSVDERSYTLRVESTVELAGRRFQRESKSVVQGFYGEPAGQSVQLKTVGAGEVTIGGRRFPTTVCEVVLDGAQGKRIVTMNVSESVEPFILRKETKTVTATGGEQPGVESLMEVLAIDMPFKVLTEIRPAAFVRTTQLQKNSVAISTVEVHCVEVPGAVVFHSSQEFDNGRVGRRIMFELVAYEVARSAQTSVIPKDEPRRRFLRHGRTRRP